MVTNDRSPLLGYAVAVLAVGVATGVKVALAPILGHDSPFLLFFGAIVLSGWFGGVEPAVLATVASAFVSAYFFFPPQFSLRIASYAARVRLVTFILEATLIGVLSAALAAARRRAEASAQSLEVAVAERTR